MKINSQRSMRKAAALALAALGLAAASPALAAKNDSDVDYGPAPSWERFKALGEEAVRGGLVDPYSAVFEWPWAYRMGPYKPILSRTIHGYMTCGLVNARNRMGGYAGRVYFVVIVKYDTVIYYNIGRDPPDLMSEMCIKAQLFGSATMAPADVPLPPPPNHGMTLLADPAGLRVERLIPGGRGEAAGVKPGMVIAKINNISLVGVSEPIAAQIVGNLSLDGTVRLEMTDGAVITLVRP